MCTAISFGGFFGRNLDLNTSFGEGFVAVPTGAVPLPMGARARFGILGIGIVRDRYPLLFDGINEAGLAAAGLNFPESAVYRSGGEVASFEVLPLVLSVCATVEEALELLSGVEVSDRAFSPSLSPSPLHFIITDGRRTAVAEPVEAGLMLFDDPWGVLTNEPPFPWHMYNLRHHMGIGSRQAECRITRHPMTPFSQGTGGLGLPGDATSPSRFIRAAFGRENAPLPHGGEAGAYQMLSQLGSVAVPKGWARADGRLLPAGGEYEYTRYSAVAELSAGEYFVSVADSLRLRHMSIAEAMPAEERVRFIPM